MSELAANVAHMMDLSARVHDAGRRIADLTDDELHALEAVPPGQLVAAARSLLGQRVPDGDGCPTCATSSSKGSGRVDVERVERLTYELLEAIGEDPTREGLRNTPKRVARWWREFIDYDPGSTNTAFEAVRADQMVILRGMKVFSLCEHHMLPFDATVAIGYISHDKVLGLSKFARISHLYAHRLQVQERLVEDIAQHLRKLLGHDDVAVTVEGDHTCMGCRGIRTPAIVSSSSLNGVFKTSMATRAEFFASVQRH